MNARRSPLADGWRPRNPPRAVHLSADDDPELIAANARRRRWNRATNLFTVAVLACLLFLVATGRLA